MTGLSQIYNFPRLYDLATGSVTKDSPDLSFYLAHAEAAPGATLELTCGSGRLTIPLAQAGVDITGLDLSPAMLKRAQAKAREHEVEIPWVEADIRSFELQRRFGLIFSPLNSLLHLHTREDFEALFRCVKRHLLPAGRFVFAVFSPSVRILAREPGTRYTFAAPVRDPQSAREIRFEETLEYDPVTQTSGATLYLSTDEEPDFLVSALNLRCLFPQELEALLHYNGMELEARHSDYEGAAFGPKSVMQIISTRVRAT